MYSPSNGFPRRGRQSDGFNNSPMRPTSHMFTPRNNSPQDFNSPRHNTSQRMYSPRNTSFQGGYSPQNSPYPRHSPMSSPHNMYSRNSTPGMNCPQRPNVYRKSFNRSRNSSDFNSSFNSNESFSPRGMPYKRNRQSFHGEQGYNIQDYINPSMLENPWAELEASQALKKTAEGKA